MNDKTRSDDFDKKLVLPDVIKENRINSEMKLGDSSRFIYLCHPLFLKLQKKKRNKQTNKEKERKKLK